MLNKMGGGRSAGGKLCQFDKNHGMKNIESIAVIASFYESEGI